LKKGGDWAGGTAVPGFLDQESAELWCVGSAAWKNTALFSGKKPAAERKLNALSRKERREPQIKKNQPGQDWLTLQMSLESECFHQTPVGGATWGIVRRVQSVRKEEKGRGLMVGKRGIARAMSLCRDSIRQIVRVKARQDRRVGRSCKRGGGG